MTWISLLCLALGLAIGVLLNDRVVTSVSPYIAVACLAGLDTLCGATRSHMEGKFDSVIMSTGFISNILIAFGISWLGDRIGVNVFLVCAFIFGQRIFINLSVIRRMLVTKWQDNRIRQEQAKAAEAGVPAVPPT